MSMSDWWMNEREPSSLQRLFPTTVIHTVFMSFPQQSYRCGLKEKSQWTQTKTTQNPYPWFSWKAITSPSFLASTKVESMHAQWPAIPVLRVYQGNVLTGATEVTSHRMPLEAPSLVIRTSTLLKCSRLGRGRFQP